MTRNRKMKVAVLFDGAGLARLGLERAGIECVGVELDPVKHYLSGFVGSGSSILGDATAFDTSECDGVWASPPCQTHSEARTQGSPVGLHAVDYLEWSFDIETPILWIENVPGSRQAIPEWGTMFNAGQFRPARQSRNRIVGGVFPKPSPDFKYRRYYEGICPTVTATEWKGCATDKRRASRFFGRKATLQECAFYQGLDPIPDGWFQIPSWFGEYHSKARREGGGSSAWYTAKNPAIAWNRQLYEAIGNGVPVWFAEAFGRAAVKAKGFKS